jgi:hypothetical protein
VAEVLGGGAQHGGAADVDALQRLREGRALRDLVLERVEVHDHHLDRRDRVLLQRGHVRGLVPARQDAAVDRGCSVFTRPSRISGEWVTSEMPTTFTLARRSSSAVPPVETSSKPALREAAGQLDDAVLAVDGEDRAACAHGFRTSGVGTGVAVGSAPRGAHGRADRAA